MDIRVKYFSEQIERLKAGFDWVDVRIADSPSTIYGPLVETVAGKRYGIQFLVKKGSLVKINLGFALELPKNYEAIIRPRGSLAKTTGLLFACSGVVDEGYRGDDDEWFVVLYATRDIFVSINQRICQFRIQEKQPELNLIEVEHLGNENRGGFGSTGDF